MTTIYAMTQSMFVNKQAQSPQPPSAIKDPHSARNLSQKPAAIEGEFIKIGDSVTQDDAQNLFERANQYAQLSANAQNGLQAYTAIDTENKREALRQLMGVDLYA